jgi:hypothetical protein
MKISLLLFAALFFSQSALAYKMTIYTDQPDGAKAEEVINTFKRTFPFNKFEIEYEVKKVSADQLNCAPQRLTKPDGTVEVINRALACNSANIAHDAAANGSDQAIIVKNVEEYGGSGGSIPVMSAGSDPRMMLHEYLHTLGLCDEYAYAANEASFYCSNAGPNMTFIEPNPVGYVSDGAAKGEHGGQIPWNEFIKPSTPITNGSAPLSLGTGQVNHEMNSAVNSSQSVVSLGSVIGLYEGNTCKNMTPPKKTWQPGREASIMEFLAAGLGAGNEMMVAKILESRGVRRKIETPAPAPVSLNDNSRGFKDGESSVENSKPESNTSR